MKIPYYQINAFTDDLFGGNPAGVCLLERWLEDETMQALAAENGLSETAFLVWQDPDWGLRWFTPRVEIDLCGHATLASAHAIMNYVDPSLSRAGFETRSGKLGVGKTGEGLLAMDFPARKAEPCQAPEDLVLGLGREPAELFRSRDFLALFERQEDIIGITPDFERLSRLEATGIIVTAPGAGGGPDFVSRFFAPRVGIDEDPVTGSAHCTLIPYWSERLGKTGLRARQVSARGGELFCEDRGDRVIIAGRAVTYVEGFINL